jgi:hypothetical protein
MNAFRIIFATVFSVTFLSCNNQLTRHVQVSEVKDEWLDLLAENNLSDWHNFNKPGQIGEAWTLQDGILHLQVEERKDWQSKGGGDIVYKEVFENFHLKLEWKISPNGNSGVMFLVQEDSAYQYPWQTGPEMQILHNEGHPDGKIITHRAGDLYDLISVSNETVKGPGEWNLAEIMVQDKKLNFFLNGKNVVSTTLWDSSWQALVAGSKFKDMPGFGSFQSGKIALQDHGDEVWFRNIMIRRL